MIELAEKVPKSTDSFVDLATLDNSGLRYLHCAVANLASDRDKMSQAAADLILKGAGSQLYARGKLKEMDLNQALARVNNRYQVFWMQEIIPGPWIYENKRLDRTMLVMFVRHRTMDGKNDWSAAFLCKIWGIWYLCDTMQSNSLIPLESEWFDPMTNRELQYERELLGTA